MGTRSHKAARTARAAWPAEAGTDPGGAMPSFWPDRMTEAVVAEARGEPSLAPDEPSWERWFERALDAGIDEELAALGRSLMRQASERGFEGDEAVESGLLDDGEAMLELAIGDPEHARAHWEALLDES